LGNLDVVHLLGLLREKGKMYSIGKFYEEFERYEKRGLVNRLFSP